jgi:hypothetical protein
MGNRTIKLNNPSMTSGTLTIVKHDDGWKRLNSTAKFDDNVALIEGYYITLRCRLPKGMAGGGDYTGGRDIEVSVGGNGRF